MREQPRGDVLIAMQLRQRVSRATVRATPVNVGTVLHEQLSHRHIPSLGGEVQGSITDLAPRKIRVGAVIEQPADARDAGPVVVRPAEDVAQRRDAARDTVDVHPKPMQQLERFEIAPTRGDVHGNAIRRIRSRFEQHLRERQMVHRTERSPQRGARQFAMPVPMVFRIGIRAPREQRACNRDEPRGALGRIVMQTGVADIEQRLPVLHAACPLHDLWIFVETCFNRRSITERKLGIQARMREGRMK